MIREVIRPQQNSFTINIPNSYIDREVEFTMFPLELDDKQEIESKNISKQNLTNSLFGALKNSNIIENDYKDYLKEKYL